MIRLHIVTGIYFFVKREWLPAWNGGMPEHRQIDGMLNPAG